MNFTLSINDSSPYGLVDGLNTVAVEHHIARNSRNIAFDMRIAATRK